MGNNKYQLYVLVVLSVGLFCADRFARPWFVDFAMQITGPAEHVEKQKYSRIQVAEIPRNRWGEKLDESLTRGGAAMAACEGDPEAEDCEEAEEEEYFDMASVDRRGHVNMAR